MSQSLSEKMSAQISEKLSDAFESVISDKNKFYQDNPQKIPDSESIQALIKSSALTNSAVSGSASLIPGPWGMMAVVPELILVSRNQIGLIYDIAAAHGQKDMMTKDLAAAIFLSGMGTTAGSLLVAHGSKFLVKRASLQVFQKMIVLLGGKITQQALKSAISKWLPGVGAAAMAAWTNYTTRQIGKKAHEIFSAGIVQEDAIADIELIPSIDPESSAPTPDHQGKSNYFYRIKILTNLAKIDGKVVDEEINFISELIDGGNFTPADTLELIAAITSTDKNTDGIDALAASPDDAIGLLVDLTSLARVDSNFHITEKLYIKQIGRMMKFSDADIEEVMQMQ